MSLARALPTLSVAALAAVVGGCGQEPTARVETGVLAIVMRDFRMVPQRASAPAGPLRIEVVNRGRLPHTFRLTGVGGTRMRISTLQPGESAVRSITLRPGGLRMLCSISNHEELGLYGTLVIR